MRFGNTDELSGYLAGGGRGRGRVLSTARRRWRRRGFWDCGLRLEGVSLRALRAEFGDEAVAAFDGVVAELVDDGLLVREGDRVALTMRGRMLSNEVFARFLGVRAPDEMDLPLLTR